MPHRFGDHHTNAKAGLALTRAIMRKLHEKNLLTTEDLNDVRKWAAAELEGSAAITDKAAVALIIATVP
jgi:hypothetical protein